MRFTSRSPLLYAGIGAALLVTALVLVLTFADWNVFKGPITRAASARFGRAVTIAGPLQVQIWSRTPTVTLTGLTIGNPPWESNRPLAKIERVQIQLELRSLFTGHLVLRRVELIHPQIYLHQEKSGRANWTFENNAPTKARARRPPRLPVLRDLVIESGTLELLDELRRLKVNGTVEAHELASGRDDKPFRIEGKGSINAEPFRLKISGGPLRALSPEQPYPFSLAITAGENDIEAEGKLLKPFDLGALELQVSAHGRDLAELYYLTQITLPNSPPFKLRAHIAREGMHLAVTHIAGSLGGSDVSGRVDIDASTKRPFVKADLVSNHLLLKDFAAITGSNAKAGASLDHGQPAGPEAQPSKVPVTANAPVLFPNAHLQVERLRAIDADVHFRATAIEAGSVPFTAVSVHARLDDRVLELSPFRFDMAQGRLNGSIRIDARASPPSVRADLRAVDVRLAQFEGARADAAPPVDGTLESRIVIAGHGDSVHNLMADATGEFTAIVPDGDVRSAFAELTGVDVAEGIGLLLKKGNAREPIRCGVAQFNIETGTAHAQEIVFDTQNVLITGRGQIALGPEKLDLTIQGQPKKLRLVRIRAPVEIRGELLKPSFELKAGPVVKQGAIAAALGTLLTPLAAILAFVDPGLAKNQNCAQLLAQAQQQAQQQAPAPLPQRTASSRSPERSR